MQIESIPYSDTKSFSKLFTDYTEASVALQPFVSVFPSIEGIESIRDQVKKQRFDRAILADVLHEQYKKAGILDGKNEQLIHSLKEENTFTVTTGHQLQILGGPLFFTYKILTTIRLAEELGKNGQAKYIPVFWLASEDHDIHEIDNIVLFDRELKWDAELNGSPISGSVSIKGLDKFLEQVDDLIRGSRFEEELKKIIRESYLATSVKDLSTATRIFVSKLFQDFPLLVIDSNDERLKRRFVKEMILEVESEFSNKAVEETTSKLEQTGYSGQASTREVNLFYINGNNRERIDRKGRTFTTINASKEWDLESIKTEIEEHPERFSPNVILRPLYQQILLPNVAYIGGPAEIAYWMQLGEVFRKTAVVFPVLIPRNSGMIMDGKQAEKLEKSGISVPQLFEEEEALIKEFVLSNAGEIELTTEKDRISEVFKDVIEKAENTDPTLKPSAEAELKKILHGIDHFQAKLIRAEKHKQEQAVNNIRKIKHKLFPGGTLQERQETIIPYYIKFGPGIIKDLYSAMQPLPKKFLVLTTKD